MSKFSFVNWVLGFRTDHFMVLESPMSIISSVWELWRAEGSLRRFSCLFRDNFVQTSLGLIRYVLSALS